MDWQAIAFGAGVLFILTVQLWKGVALRIDRPPWIPLVDPLPDVREYVIRRDESEAHFWLSIALQITFFSIVWCFLFA